jgi:ribosome-binding factor A
MKYRKLRVQDLLREEISLIIQREIRDPGMGFITILDVKMGEDLKIAKVYLSIYGDEGKKAATLEALKRSKNYIKFLLGKRVKLRYMPELYFVIDDTYEKAARIEEILRKEILHHKPHRPRRGRLRLCFFPLLGSEIPWKGSSRVPQGSGTLPV